MITFALGTIGLGRQWGHVPGEVPSEAEALRFLEHAWEAGVRFFDTAPSYGTSEERLGKFLRSLDRRERVAATVATKFGEHWNSDAGEPIVDHSYDALRRSLDVSVERLGSVDFLQLHKTTPTVLASNGLDRAWEYARKLGIRTVGPSVSDLESAELALADRRYGCMQFPLNLTNRKFSEIARRAAAGSLFVLANRPFAMGAMLHEAQPLTKDNAFRYVLEHGFTGAILSGTRNIDHLQENLQAFRKAEQSLERR